MNNQEIFDTVARHLIKQGKPAVNVEGECMYRAPDGLKCAVGCLIPDEKYDVRIEGFDVSVIIHDHPGMLPGIGGENLRLLEDLQTLHDGCWETQRQLLSGVREIARAFGLNQKALRP